MFLCLSPKMADAEKKPKPCTKVGYFNRRNPDKLVAKLTKNIQNDSLKVEAIYCWITSNIRYNVKALMDYDLFVGNSNQTLRKRKTTCLGYALLFKDLCQRAGIRTEVVTGYTKNMDVDINDSFYVGDHAWNATYINGRWYLFDPTWDAGYVKTWRMGNWNWFLFLVSIGEIENYNYKPKFIFNTSRKFSFKSGDYFLYDHLPENPIWQLTDKTWSTAEFMKDSSYYYINDRSEDDSYSLEWENERQAYGIDGDTATAIYDGHAFHQYNDLNELNKVHAINLSNRAFFNQANLHSTDTAEMLQLADSLDKYVDLAYLHLDSLEKLIQLEEDQKLFHLKTKNNILKQDVKTLNASNKKVQKSCRKGILFTKKYYQNSRSFLKNQAKSIIKLNNDPRYKELEFKNKDNNKAQNYRNKIDSLSELIDSLNYELEITKVQFDEIMNSILNRIELSREFQSRKLYLLEVLKFYRISNFDDLDFPIRSVKDSLMTQNAAHDTDLFTNKKLVYDSLLIINKRIQLIQKEILKQEIKTLSFIRKLKSNSIITEQSEIDSMYYNELQKIQLNFIELADWYQSENAKGDDIRRANRLLNYLSKSTKKYVNREKQFIVKPTLIKKRRKLLKVIQRKHKYSTDTFKRRSRVIRSKYSKK
ncbi:MAG: hypothetical protein IT245_05545 [Bacteroidia bacterium]|nr:hypothetical protein [Bacteroidia bacterium]